MGLWFSFDATTQQKTNVTLRILTPYVKHAILLSDQNRSVSRVFCLATAGPQCNVSRGYDLIIPCRHIFMSNNKLFVGNLPYQMQDADLGSMFAEAGTVLSAHIMMDKMTNRSRGFGFVEMSTDEEALKAIELTNGAEVEGRAIVVNIARPREERPPRRDFGGGGRPPRRDFGGNGGGHSSRRDY